MSYILEALKKSERERGNGSVPGIQTIHSSSLNYHQEKKSIWPLLLSVLVVINIGILVFFIVDRNSQPPASTQSRNQDMKNINAVADIQYEIGKDAYYPDTVKSAASVKQEILPGLYATNQSNTKSTPVTAEETEANVISIYDIPLNVRQYIPEMQFSAHVYSSNPAQRSIVINNQFMEEGDTVTNGLMLSEITRDGAIFEFEGYRFSTSVLSGWDDN